MGGKGKGKRVRGSLCIMPPTHNDPATRYDPTTARPGYSVRSNYGTARQRGRLVWDEALGLLGKGAWWNLASYRPTSSVEEGASPHVDRCPASLPTARPRGLMGPDLYQPQGHPTLSTFLSVVFFLSTHCVLMTIAPLTSGGSTMSLVIDLSKLPSASMRPSRQQMVLSHVARHSLTPSRPPTTLLSHGIRSPLLATTTKPPPSLPGIKLQTHDHAMGKMCPPRKVSNSSNHSTQQQPHHPPTTMGCCLDNEARHSLHRDRAPLLLVTDPEDYIYGELRREGARCTEAGLCNSE